MLNVPARETKLCSYWMGPASSGAWNWKKKQLSTYVDMEPFISVRQLGLGACAVFQFDLQLLLVVLQRQLLVS
jgi:hypothetical protein